MKARLLHLLEALPVSFWVIPGLMAASAIALSFLSLYLDQWVSRQWNIWLGIFFK